MLQLLTNRREDPVGIRAQTINRLHRLLVDLVPAGGGRNLTANRATALLRRAREPAHRRSPATARAGSDRDVRDLDRRIAAVEARIETALDLSRTTLVELSGVDPVLAAKLLGEVGDAGRLPSDPGRTSDRQRYRGGTCAR